MKARIDPRTVAALAVTLLFWASAFAGIRAGLQSYSPGQLALLRFLVASAVLAAYAAATRMHLPHRRDLPAILLLGFAGITVYHVALNYGEVTVTAGAASLLIALSPVFTALLAVIFLGERLGGWGWVGIAVSFLGGALIALGEGERMRFSLGAVLILLAAFSTSLYYVLQKPYLGRYSPLQFTACAIWAGTLLMLPFLPGLAGTLRTAPPAATLAVVYLGVFPGAVSYVTWSYVLSRVPASRAGTFLYLAPPLATAIAWIWLGETPPVISLVGGLVSLLGVALVNARRR